MSKFTNNTKERVQQLLNYALELHNGGHGGDLIKKYEEVIDSLMPSDLIILFHRLMEEDIEISELKVLTNKVLNVFYKSVNEYPGLEPQNDSLLGLLKEDNTILIKKLNSLKPEIKRFNKNTELLNNEEYKSELLEKFTDIQKFISHYTLKENLLFPILEKEWEDYKCVQLMWSYHDDIRKHLKWIISHLEEGEIDLKMFNRSIGDLFFVMFAIVFREDQILFPFMLESISNNDLDKLIIGLKDIPLAYVDTSKIIEAFEQKNTETDTKEIDLGTGSVTAEQIIMMFNHLPVDITYVDENDEVKYFSTPKHRIFPRTIAVIGRKVHHCHPPESVHIVEQIVASFKSGEKSEAAFWIKMGPNFVLIKYFAVRDAKKQYRGVLEVSQEISEIKALEGERRLLDW